MADSHEAQLLSDLLRDIAREDARVDAAHLETRVMEAVDAGASVRLKPDTTHWETTIWAVAAAAAVAVAVLVPAMPWLKTLVTGQHVQVKVNATEEVVAEESNADGRAEASGPANAGHVVLRPPKVRAAKPAMTPSAIAASPIDPSPIAQSSIAPIPQSPLTQSLEEFVPLMPMTERELTGPFQLVRVQMPRASLGVLRSPLEHPHELVEADVLLGEDGMARAIRVSKSGSVYPWRSR
jgi:hypothetical protein